MDLIIFIIVAVALVICRTSLVTSQTCSATTTSPTLPVTLFTNNPTVGVGGGSGSTLNLGVANSPTTNTINIGGTGSTVTISPVPSPGSSSNPVTTINGINPLGWFASTGVTTPATSNANAAIGTTIPLPPTNLNPRAATPSPSTIPYVTACTSFAPAPSFTAYPATVTLTSVGSPSLADCIILPKTGYYSITGSITLSTNSPSFNGWISMDLAPATASPVASVSTYNVLNLNAASGAGNVFKVPVNKVVFSPSSAPSPVGTAWYFLVRAGSNYVVTSYGGIPHDLSIQYLGPP